MSDNSHIEWTDATWNPLRGCTKVSPGCAHCYAATFAERFRGVPGHPYEQGFDLRLVPEKLEEPLKWRRPRHVFVNSMSDLFHEQVPSEYVGRVIETMRRADWHIFQVLTKRASRMRELLISQFPEALKLTNVWWGVSVEDRKHGVPRIAELQRIPTVTRFLSVEPLLEDLGTLDLRGIAWVIVGGESGWKARPMREEWVTNVLHQSEAAGAEFFFKQWGGVFKRRAGRMLGGRTYDGMPATFSARNTPAPPA